MHVVFYTSTCTVYLLLPFVWAKCRMCWCDGGQEQQSAKSLIIDGGKCEAFWGCRREGARAGRNARLNVAFLRLLAAAVAACSGNMSLHVGWVIKQHKQTGREGPGRNAGEAGKQPNAKEDNKKQPQTQPFIYSYSPLSFFFLFKGNPL